jgi:heme-degrading monooxygenase HmoA
MVVVVFRSRSRAGAEAEMTKEGERMYAIASAMPGFVSYKDFIAEDGEVATIVEFDTLEHLAAWRDHPEHKRVQARGRNEFFAEYRIQVCTTERDYSFRRATET